jgi:hypothetical protein
MKSGSPDSDHAVLDGELFVFGSNLAGIHGAGAARFARQHAEQRYFVTRVGCGLAGYTDADIAPMFATAPDNCRLPPGWRELGATHGQTL